MNNCKYQSKCGSCTYLDKTYKEQLNIKQNKVSTLMKPMGEVLPIIGMDQPYYYRNKVHAVFGEDRQKNILAGTYEKGSHRIVDMEGCLLENEKAASIILTIKKLMKSFKYKPYNEDTRRGFLRHVLVRTAHNTGQILVVIVVGDKMFPSKNNFVKALRKEHPEITTIVSSLNDRNTSMILGEREEVIYGKGYIEDVLCGKRFKLSPKSFYQVNSIQTEILYKKAIEWADLKGNERILDAYSGIGTIGIAASDFAGEVVGVELNKDAVKDAQFNCKLNGLKKAKYLLGDAGEFMRKEAAKGSRYDVVFMDPPRAGSDQMFLDAVVTLAPSKLIYISCNPETLERDAKYLKKKGYQMQKCMPVDMFPWTEHVETVCSFVPTKTK